MTDTLCGRRFARLHYVPAFPGFASFRFPPNDNQRPPVFCTAAARCRLAFLPIISIEIKPAVLQSAGNRASTRYSHTESNMKAEARCSTGCQPIDSTMNGEHHAHRPSNRLCHRSHPAAPWIHVGGVPAQEGRNRGCCKSAFSQQRGTDGKFHWVLSRRHRVSVMTTMKAHVSINT